MSADKGSPLPKFGEWDVNNPASFEGFTVIFNKARDEKKINTSPGVMPPQPRNTTDGHKPEDHSDLPNFGIKWFCCV